MPVSTEVSLARYITVGAVLVLGMLFVAVANCAAHKAAVQTKCIEAGHDPAACNNLRIG